MIMALITTFGLFTLLHDIKPTSAHKQVHFPWKKKGCLEGRGSNSDSLWWFYHHQKDNRAVLTVSSKGIILCRCHHSELSTKEGHGQLLSRETEPNIATISSKENAQHNKVWPHVQSLIETTTHKEPCTEHCEVCALFGAAFKRIILVYPSHELYSSLFF